MIPTTIETEPRVLIAPTPQMLAQQAFRRAADALGVPIEWTEQLIAYCWRRERPACPVLESILWGSLTGYAGLVSERRHQLGLPATIKLLMAVDELGDRFVHPEIWGDRERVNFWVSPPMPARAVRHG